MKQLFLLIQIVIAMMALGSGILCYIRPSRAIEIQQKFYEKINWKIEPINVDKELRNTKIMGALNVLLAISITILLMVKW